MNAGWAATEGMDLAIIVQHVHYRFTLSIAGYGLRHIKGTYELLTTCHHAFRGMYSTSDVTAIRIFLLRLTPMKSLF